MTSIAAQINQMSVNETRNVSVSFAGKLDTGETLSGTPTITELNTSSLTLTNKVVNTSALTINDVSVPIGEAIQFTLDATAVGRYQVRIICGTSASQVLDGIVKIVVS